MGLAAARSSREGAALVIVGRDGERAKRAAAELGEARVLALSADVSRRGSVEPMMERALAFLGQLDESRCSQGSPGTSRSRFPTSAESQSSRRDARQTRVIRSALPHLKQRGTIVTTAAYSVRAPELARLPYSRRRPRSRC
jgi:NAD(P)-dependent dehydrogenase (short-subunit alcohol dehydrogenase family)